ncbi:DNA-binding protein [Kosakonia sacchari]|uniref:ParB/RepB/Spo0J family partition protein n=1 Tax=Kosakonia sacchari TaxID=1158459 RepID=UPI0008074945|nr:DNA-binding protein [Kosakonia sacchari]ANR76980.1 DNA-binding protein [Kosakonia sacchari]
MSSLYQHYKKKGDNGTGIVVNRTFIVPISELYVEPGLNIRDVDLEHVNEFRDAFISGEYVPPLAVQVTEQGVKIIDGHHRYYGALAATAAGTEIARIECKDFVGSEADRIAFMITSSQGKALSPLERAAAYQRLVNQGRTPAEIAKMVKRSVADVDHHLQLLSCGDELIDMVKAGEVSASTAVALSREHGAQAASVATRQMDKAKAAGKTKLSRSAAIPQLSPARARRLAELLVDAEIEDNRLTVSSTALEEVMTIIGEQKSLMRESGWEEA